jgi:very-short-patch-repair endonuclease
VLQQNLVTADKLKRLLAAQHRCVRRALISEVISDFTGGITTMGERDFAALCRAHQIRTPDRQVRRKDSSGKSRYLDVYFDAERVVVEIDGLGHLDPDQWIDDLGRQNDLVLGGDRIVLRVSTWEVKHDADRFIQQLKTALGLRCLDGL